MVDKKLWCLTTYFNPAHYKSRPKNFDIFINRMISQNVNIKVIELAFGDDEYEINSDIKLRSKSILWQKERMLNAALSTLPDDCEYIAWIDGDVLFPDDSWKQMTVEEFEKGADIIQMFEEVRHLAPTKQNYEDETIMSERSLTWQAKNHPDFISLRKQNKLLYATTGFAWAGRRSIFKNCGFYDKHILGANDNIIIDSCLNTFELHHYFKVGQGTKIMNDMMAWTNRFGLNRPCSYLPLSIRHLFHGHKKDRGYLSREDIVKKHDYDPDKDITLKENVYEWNSEKSELHSDVKNYFASRNEDC